MPLPFSPNRKLLRFRLAVYTDGLTWTKYANNPVIATGAGWESSQVDWGALYHDGQQFRMWYLGHMGVAGFSLGYASSADGKTFLKSGNNPVLPPPMPLIISTDYAVNKGDGLGIENSAKVLRLGSSWWFYYGGFASCCPEDATLSLATAPVKNSPNRAPQVDAGANQKIVLPTSATLSGTVMDDDVPVTLDKVQSQWSQVSGPGNVVFGAASQLSTKATFSAPGTYVLRLTANDTALTQFADVSIDVLPVGSDAGIDTDASVGGDATVDIDGGRNQPIPDSGGCSCEVALTRSSGRDWLSVLAVALSILVRRRNRNAAMR